MILDNFYYFYDNYYIYFKIILLMHLFLDYSFIYRHAQTTRNKQKIVHLDTSEITCQTSIWSEFDILMKYVIQYIEGGSNMSLFHILIIS